MTTATEKSFRVERLWSAIITVSGAVLMAGKIVADSEPGAIPLLLVVLGAAWYVSTRIRARGGQKAD